MLEIGYKLSSEEFGPEQLVEQAVLAERAGFTFALISDHFHPWTDPRGRPVRGGRPQGDRRATTTLG
jgi:alkanesulfonate monooxygenase SsuD/methylene tetrahydromethanopterin reductase-like flavin-dependent oxidoreductase (luciferase family)